MSVDLTILCGFLGSGKTTLLVDFLQSGAASDTAVIVNEVGEIGVDGVIVDDGSQGKVPMMMLANGCVCCSLRSSLVFTVASVLDAPRPPGSEPLRRIILETSGLSRPGPIIASLADPELARRGLRVNVVSTYDAQRGSLNVDTYDEAVAQLAAASRVVFTKMDIADPSSLTAHREVMTRVNPLADLVVEPSRAQAVEQAFAEMNTRAPQDLAAQALRLAGQRGNVWGNALNQQTRFAEAAGTDTPNHDRVTVLLGRRSSPVSWDDLAQWLDDLAGGCGERLLRVKAIVKVNDAEGPILIQSVGTTFSAPQVLARQVIEESICVVIVRDLDATQINGFFLDPVFSLMDSTDLVQ